MSESTPRDPSVDPAVSPSSQPPVPDETATEGAIAPSSEASPSLSEEDAAAARRRILIGSQREPDAYRPRRRDWIPVETPPPAEAGGSTPAAPAESAPLEPTAKLPDAPSQPVPEVAAPAEAKPARKERFNLAAAVEVPKPPSGRVTPPNLRDHLSADMEEEFDRALAGTSLDDLLIGGKTPGDESTLEPDTRVQGRVVVIRREEAFIELGGRDQGSLPIHQFETPPQVGDVVEVVVRRYNPDDGLYDLSLPNKSVQVEDWGDLATGMVVEARVTGHNTGGLECEVNHIRGFIPISQVALYRVEGLEEFVGQSWPCVITEANPDRQNLVLSRRAILEREKEEQRQTMLASLQPGEVREGTVRKLMDFGAFVDIGGVDGLLHISQLAWHRVQHPRDILTEGQRIEVRVEKVDPTTGKISLAYRELQQSPWTRAAENYPANTVVRGKVTKLMEFGAFVALEPGVEGLVHISELAHKRVFRTSDVVKEGDEVEVLVLSLDAEAQRISLSMKALSPLPKPKTEESGEAAVAEAAPPPPPRRQGPEKPLQGGLGRGSGGAQFGLKW